MVLQDANATVNFTFFPLTIMYSSPFLCTKDTLSTATDTGPFFPTGSLPCSKTHSSSLNLTSNLFPIVKLAPSAIFKPGSSYSLITPVAGRRRTRWKELMVVEQDLNTGVVSNPLQCHQLATDTVISSCPVRGSLSRCKCEKRDHLEDFTLLHYLLASKITNYFFSRNKSKCFQKKFFKNFIFFPVYFAKHRVCILQPLLCRVFHRSYPRNVQK